VSGVPSESVARLTLVVGVSQFRRTFTLPDAARTAGDVDSPRRPKRQRGYCSGTSIVQRWPDQESGRTPLVILGLMQALQQRALGIHRRRRPALFTAVFSSQVAVLSHLGRRPQPDSRPVPTSDGGVALGSAALQCSLDEHWNPFIAIWIRSASRWSLWAGHFFWAVRA